MAKWEIYTASADPESFARGGPTPTCFCIVLDTEGEGTKYH